MPTAIPASQGRAPVLAETSMARTKRPRYPATRTTSVNARPASLAQIIDSAVKAPNAARHPPVAIASDGIGRRGTRRVISAMITTHQTPTVAAAMTSVE